MTLGDGNSHERLAIQIEGHTRFMCYLLIGNGGGVDSFCSRIANAGVQDSSKDWRSPPPHWLDSLQGVGWLSPLTLGLCVWRFARLAQDSGRAVRR